MGLRQIMVFADAHAHAHAPDAARAYGLQGLHNLVARALGVSPGIEQRQDPFEPIRLENAQQRADSRAYGEKLEFRRPFHIRADEHQQRDAADDQRRSHIRLLLHQNGHQADQVHLVVKEFALHAVIDAPRDVVRLQENSGGFRELRGLYLHRAERQPALRPVDLHADKSHRDQHRGHEECSHHPSLHQYMVIDDKPDQETDQTHAQVHPLLAQEKIRVVVIRPRHHEAGAEHVERADEDQDDCQPEDGLVIAHPKAKGSPVPIMRLRLGHRCASPPPVSSPPWAV